MYATTDIHSLTDLVNLSAAFDPHKSDYKARSRDLTVDPQGGLAVATRGLFEGTQTRLDISDYALGQMATRLEIPPVYLRRCPAELRSQNLNHWLRANPHREWLVRAYAQPAPQARAALSGVYAPLDNSLVLEATRNVLGQTPHKLVRPYLDRDTLHAKITFADEQGGNYAIGVYIVNGETGNHALGFSPFIQRHSCENSILFTEEGFVQRHAYVSPAYIAATIKEKVGQMLGKSADLLDDLVKAEADRIPDIGQVVADLCRDRGLSQTVHDLILMGTENQNTRMGVVNGLSFAAQHLEEVEPAIELEKMAGQFLLNPRRAHRAPRQMELARDM